MIMSSTLHIEISWGTSPLLLYRFILYNMVAISSDTNRTFGFSDSAVTSFQDVVTGIGSYDLEIGEDGRAEGSGLYVFYQIFSAQPLDVTLYAVFRQTITLGYNGNGNTGGSTASQSGTRYYNNGNVANPSFVLRTNGFTRTSYGFQNWAMGSTSGTRYSSGASVTLATSTTFFAMWKLTSIPTSAANSLNIGDPYWQADRKDERKTIGPYDMTGVNTLTFDLSVKAAHGTTTNVWVGLSSNGIDFARSTSYSLSDAGEVGGSNTYDDPLLSVNVSGLSGNYYIMHRVQISSYCYSYCNSIAVS